MKIQLTESELRRYINETIAEMLNSCDEPIEVCDGVYITDINFGRDNDGYIDGEVHISIDGNDYDEGDSFVTDFELNTNRLEALLNNRYIGDRVTIDDDSVASCVQLYQGVQYDPEVKKALCKAIVKQYHECEYVNEEKSFKIGGLKDQLKANRKASREEEFEKKGPGFHSTKKTWKTSKRDAQDRESKKKAWKREF